MDKQKAIQIIKDAPVDWEYFATSNERFYKKAYDRWFFYSGSEWLECEKLTPLYSSRASMIPKSEILKIAGVEEMKYPYIGKSKHENGRCVLFTSEGSGFQITGGDRIAAEMNFYIYWKEEVFKNITHEYLANTYGEVVSPEHAEFIIELAKNAGFKFGGGQANLESVKSFMIYKDSFDIYDYDASKLSNELNRKQITIPLPPKQIQTATPEEEFEMEQIMKNAGDNLVLGCEQDFKVARRILNELREEANCSDELLTSHDEWPKIGDEVLVYPSARRLVEIKGKAVKVIGKCTHSDGDTILTVEHSSLGVFAVTNGSWIQKPKTPEEELRDEFRYDVGFFSAAYGKASTITEKLLEKYNITKKPQ